MKQRDPSKPALTASAFAEGVIASSLNPFDGSGTLLLDLMGKQADRLARIDGVIGVAVNTTMRERLSLSLEERLNIVQETRSALGLKRLILACVGPLCSEVEDEVSAYREAGADAVITFPPSWRAGPGTPDFDHHIEGLVEIAERFHLPIIAVAGESRNDLDHGQPDISSLAGKCLKVIGVDMGTNNDVSHYDQAYYALKAIERPLACLPSSEAALFHNLNTGADGAMSCMAFIAPYEVVALYQAVRSGSFYEAQAVHNRLTPLAALFSGKDILTREMILREIAYQRGLLPSPIARGLTHPLSQNFCTRIKNTLEAIGLKPIPDFAGNP